MNNEHTASTFTKVIAAAIAVFLLALASIIVGDHFSAPVHAQTAGTVGILSSERPLLTAATATGCSPIVADIGQGSNIMFVAETDTSGGTAIFDFEWSPSGSSGPWYVITQGKFIDSAANTHSLPLNGYFPNLRVCLNTYTNGTWSAWYTATSGPLSLATPAIGTNGPTSPPLCDQSTATEPITNGATTFIGPTPVIMATDTVIVCSIAVSFLSAPSTGSLGFEWYSSSACSTSPVLALLDYTTASTPQLYTRSTGLRSVVGGRLGAISNSLCLINNSGVSVSVTVSWGSIHGL